MESESNYYINNPQFLEINNNVLKETQYYELNNQTDYQIQKEFNKGDDLKNLEDNHNNQNYNINERNNENFQNYEENQNPDQKNIYDYNDYQNSNQEMAQRNENLTYNKNFHIDRNKGNNFQNFSEKNEKFDKNHYKEIEQKEEDISKFHLNHKILNYNYESDNNKFDNLDKKNINSDQIKSIYTANSSNNDNVINIYNINSNKLSSKLLSNVDEDKSDNLKKYNLQMIEKNSSNKVSHINNIEETQNENLLIQNISKENLNSKISLSLIDTLKNHKTKLNLTECSKDELELLEKLVKNNSIKVENEDYFQSSKNELIMKFEQNNTQNKENNDFGMNLLRSRPTKKENFLNDNEKIIYFEIENFKSILNFQIQEKKEKEFELNNSKDLIKSLNNQINVKDEIIKNNSEINNKYNELLKEFYILQEETNRIYNENAYLKNSVLEMSGLNEIILKNYHNKLIDFGDLSNRLLSITLNEDGDKN